MRIPDIYGIFLFTANGTRFLSVEKDEFLFLADEQYTRDKIIIETDYFVFEFHFAYRPEDGSKCEIYLTQFVEELSAEVDRNREAIEYAMFLSEHRESTDETLRELEALPKRINPEQLESIIRQRREEIVRRFIAENPENLHVFLRQAHFRLN